MIFGYFWLDKEAGVAANHLVLFNYILNIHDKGGQGGAAIDHVVLIK